MKTNKVTSTLALVASLFVLPVLASAKDTAAATDRAAQLLASNGTVELSAVGRTIELGTYRVEVVTKLGAASAVLSDGTRFYAGYQIDDSNARGTLVVRFDDKGRVSKLTLVTPAVASAIAAAQKSGSQQLVAATKR